MLNSLIYRKFFYQIPDFLVVINRDYRVEMCNWRGAYQYVPKERRRPDIKRGPEGPLEVQTT